MAEPRPSAVQAIENPRPLDVVEELVADAIYADVWTKPRPSDPEWHHRFPHWMAVQAARLAVEALREAGHIASTQEKGRSDG